LALAAFEDLLVCRFNPAKPEWAAVRLLASAVEIAVLASFERPPILDCPTCDGSEEDIVFFIIEHFSLIRMEKILSLHSLLLLELQP
jgi:hypothetical protein